MIKQKVNKRRHLRFPPDEWEMALIQCSEVPVDDNSFRPEISALVMEESRAGCGLVVLERQASHRLKPGDRCSVKVARLGVVQAEVRWINIVDDGIARVGLHYIE